MQVGVINSYIGFPTVWCYIISHLSNIGILHTLEPYHPMVHAGRQGLRWAGLDLCGACAPWLKQNEGFGGSGDVKLLDICHAI